LSFPTLPSGAVEFDVPDSWIRVELDHLETWRYLSDEIVKVVSESRRRGLAENFVDDSTLRLELTRLCEQLQRSGMGAVAARALLANVDEVPTLISGIVILALTPCEPALKHVDELASAWKAESGATDEIVELPAGPALRIDLERVGPGLLQRGPLTYHHTRFLMPTFDGSQIAVMDCSAPKAIYQCFELAFDLIARSLRQAD
jgi:hypothetical protein